MSDVFVKEYTPLDYEQKIRVNQIKTDAEKLYESFDWARADKRMMAIAKTNLEQAVMWAVKAVTNP